MIQCIKKLILMPKEYISNVLYTLLTSLFMFHLISFSPHFIDHVSFYFLESTTLHWSFLFPSVHNPSHSFHLPQSISFMFTLLFGCIHITWSFIVSFTFQPILSLEINDLQVSLDEFLILDRYSLYTWSEADLQCFVTPYLFTLNKKHNKMD